MPKTFRENLREELDYQDMKVKELAVATGIPKPTLDCYLSARQVIPPADIAVKIAQALNVSVAVLQSTRYKVGARHVEDPWVSLVVDIFPCSCVAVKVYLARHRLSCDGQGKE